MSETANKVLEAAVVAFAELGFEGASVRQICKAAGVNAQAIHYHFGSKDKLYRAVLQRFVDEQDVIIARLVTSEAASVEDLRTRLLFFLDTIMEFWLRGRGLEVVYQEAKRHGTNANFVAESMLQLDGALVALLEGGQRAGLVRPDIDLALVVSTLTERVGGQAIDADMMEHFLGYSVRKTDTRHAWVGRFIDLILFGIVDPRATGPPKRDT